MTIRVLLALAAALVAGALVATTQSPLLLRLVPLIEPVGTLWLNALRMTVIPLVVSLLVIGMSAASGSMGAARGAAPRTLVLVILLLTAGALFGGLAGPVLLRLWPIPSNTATAFNAAAMRSGSAAEAEVPSLAEWVTALVPSNAISSAADGALLPLVFFSVILGLAVTRLSEPSRASLLGFFGALSEAMLVIVQWVLRLAPVGVFALVFPMAASGVQLAGALRQYVVLRALLCIIAALALYPLVGTAGGTTVRRFAKCIAPAQAVALSTRSSLATLPAMLDSARRLGIPTDLSGVVLPLAVTLMRFCSPLLNVFKVAFVAALLDVPLGPLQIGIAAAMAIALSLASVGLPGEVGFMAANIPIFQALGLPLEALALLLAVEVIPDMFKTVGNVTADIAIAALVARGHHPAMEAAPIPAAV